MGILEIIRDALPEAIGGLPVGLQIMGDAFAEEAVLRAAYAYEQATEWYKRQPVL